MEPDLFRDLVVSRPAPRLRRWIWPTSLAGHTVVVAALVTVPLVATNELPAPSAAVRAFFVSPEAPPAPPPPPPTRAAERNVTRPPVQNQTPRLTAPVEIPDEVSDPATTDLGVEGGTQGGVEGGVAGGVVGGIVGGIESAPLAVAQHVVTYVTEPRKLRVVAPVYPEVARLAHVQGAVVVDCVVDKRGHVAEAIVVNSVSPLLNEAAVDAVRQWVYAPTLVDGVPTSLRIKVTVTFSLSRAASL
jgi:periplasmic protein TonB